MLPSIYIKIRNEKKFCTVNSFKRDLSCLTEPQKNTLLSLNLWMRLTLQLTRRDSFLIMVEKKQHKQEHPPPSTWMMCHWDAEFTESKGHTSLASLPQNLMLSKKPQQVYQLAFLIIAVSCLKKTSQTAIFSFQPLQTQFVLGRSS